ncbi:MAG: SRPBCC family protein [Pseudomonadales bacterium]|nr:SRPBCC family protein [Pseudomonadales bacterium]
MNLETVNPQSDQAGVEQAFFSLCLGPRPDCASLVWKQLSEFERWPTWFSGIRSLQQLDSGQAGRGSKLQLNYRGEHQTWEILYWEPERRLDFEINDRGLRCGLSFQLKDQQKERQKDQQNQSQQADSIDLQLHTEFINTGAALPGYFRHRKILRLAKLFMRDFSRNISPAGNVPE